MEAGRKRVLGSVNDPARHPLKRVAAYIRVSADSLDQENSYEVQEQYFAGLLAQNPEWASAGIYSDYGISGTSGQRRTGYKRLLRHCREGKIDRIVCKSISRFARNTSDFIAALTILRENHVTILFEKEGVDTAAPISDFILVTLAAVAQEESWSISSNIRWGIRKRYPKGQVRNHEIYGYRYAEGEDRMEALAEGYQVRRVEIVEEEAAVVRRIFRAAEEGERYSDIARRLNYEHIPAPGRGKTGGKMCKRAEAGKEIETGWTADVISRMLTQERYCGDVLLQKTYTPDFLTHKSRKNNGELPKYMVRDHHPAIISREQWERVQRLRQVNAARFCNKGSRKKHPFSGRLICAGCGRAYNVRNVSRYPIWFCPMAELNNGKELCHAEKIYEEQAVRMFRKAFIDRFHLISGPVLDNVRAADIVSGRYGEDEGILIEFDKNADDFVGQIRQRLFNIQRMDFMERDRSFLKRQIKMRKEIISGMEYRSHPFAAQRDEGRIREAARIQEAEAEMTGLEQRLAYLESYWEQLEDGYEERDKALKWMETLPKGQEGTAAFLNGLTSAYVKAFALSILVHDPLHYTVRWFDDTYTEVEMDSNVEDFRCTAAYFDGQRMRERYRK